MSDHQPAAVRSSWLACGGTLLSVLACYGTLAVVAVLSLMGISLAINVHVWAAAIVLFAVVALLGIALTYRSHHHPGPLCVAIPGTLFIVLAMYGSNLLDSRLGVSPRAVELLGFAALAVAAIWDWRLKTGGKSFA